MLAKYVSNLNSATKPKTVWEKTRKIAGNHPRIQPLIFQDELEKKIKRNYIPRILLRPKYKNVTGWAAMYNKKISICYLKI